jgi:hypothetical protein
MVRDFSEGKIYKIIPCLAHEEDEIYIGSTTKLLLNRLKKHKARYTQYKKGKSRYFTVFKLFDKYGKHNCKIILIEDYPCESSEELLFREGHHIKENVCVNKVVNGRSKAESRFEYMKKKYVCDCGKEVVRNNKHGHDKSRFHLEYLELQDE